MENPKSPNTFHPGWTLILIAVFLLVLTIALILTHQVPPDTLITALLPILACTAVGLLWLRARP